MGERSDRLSAMRKLLNKKAGHTVAYNLNEENPTVVQEWIPTGSRWLDSIICDGKMAGIPMGKVVEIAGEPSTGKSYMALQIGINALKKDIDVVYFDSESALDNIFMEKMGYDMDNFMYIQATTCEFVLETIEELLKANEKPMLFIWDSLAQTTCVTEAEGNFDPQSTVAVKARVLARGFQKLTIPLANHGSSFLIVNQLKTNIGNQFEPWSTPGGKAAVYSYSLRLWLTVSNTKKNRIDDDAGEQVGSHVTVRIKKSRFGSQGKRCHFKILWREREYGEKISILDQESWLDAIKPHPRFKCAGWNTLTTHDGEEIKFQKPSWLEKLKDEKFYNEVIAMLDELYIRKPLEESSEEEK